MSKLTKLISLLSIAISLPAIGLVASANPDYHHQQIADVRMGHGDKLKLTPVQKAKMEQLRQSVNTQIEQVLTTEQRQKFQQIEGKMQARRQARASLNLTADQQAKIKAIHQADRQQFDAILTPAQQTQLKQDRDNHSPGGRLVRLEKLNLTPAQKTKLEQLKAGTDNQMDAILTPEQRQKSQLMRGEREEMKDTWKSLNLTTEQKAKIKAIRQANQSQFKAILTPEQQLKFKSGKRGIRNHSMQQN